MSKRFYLTLIVYIQLVTKTRDGLTLLVIFILFLLYLINQDIGNLSGIEPLIEKLVAQVWITMLACKDGRHDISGWDMGMTHGWTTYDCVTCVHAILGCATLYYVAYGWSMCD